MLMVKGLIAFVLIYLLAGVVHEMGHIIVGLINKWKFYLLVVGPIGLKRNDQDRVVMYFEKNPVLWGGVGATLPREINKNNIEIWKKILLAGPLASILLGLVFIPVFIVTDSIFALLLCAMPLGMGVMSILPLPMKTGVLYTDGYRYKRLQGGGQAYLEEKALFHTTQLSVCDKLEKLDITETEHLINSKDSTVQYFGHYFAYKYYSMHFDDAQVEHHKECMKGLEKSVPKLVIEDCEL